MASTDEPKDKLEDYAAAVASSTKESQAPKDMAQSNGPAVATQSAATLGSKDTPKDAPKDVLDGRFSSFSHFCVTLSASRFMFCVNSPRCCRELSGPKKDQKTAVRVVETHNTLKVQRAALIVQVIKNR